MKPSTEQCRSSKDGCDIAEYCSGGTKSCPDDAWHPQGVVCRPAADPLEGDRAHSCDVEEVCPGNDKPCPQDSFVEAGATCRKAADAITGVLTSSGTLAESGLGEVGALQAPPFRCARPEGGQCGADLDCPLSDQGIREACRMFSDGLLRCVDVLSADVCDASDDCQGRSDDVAVPDECLEVDAAVGSRLAFQQALSTEFDVDLQILSAEQLRDAVNSADVGVIASLLPTEVSGTCSVGGDCPPSRPRCGLLSPLTGDGWCVAEEPADQEVFLKIESTDPGAVGTIELIRDDSAFGLLVLEGSGPDCDIAESCTGNDALCPEDEYRGKNGATHVCRDAVGVCDLPEVCPDQPDAGCPDDLVQTDTEIVCRASAGSCDVVEKCDGGSASCPPDAKKIGECRMSMGACDPAEFCDGGGNDCPADELATGEVCRSSLGACDVEEVCDGNVECPSDVLRDATYVCRPSADTSGGGSCDPVETCDGASFDCPADERAPEGQACTDGQDCTTQDACSNGLCFGTPITCGDGIVQMTCEEGSENSVVEQCDDGVANGTPESDCDESCQLKEGFACPATPAPSCLTTRPGGSSLRIKDVQRGGGARFDWRWVGGEAFEVAGIGDPTVDFAAGGSSLTLCVYEGAGADHRLLARAVVPAGGQCGSRTLKDCWKATGARGFKFNDSKGHALPNGISKVVVRAGRKEGTSKILFQASGGRFPLPSRGGFGVASLAEIHSRLTLQLHASSGTPSPHCFESAFEPPFRRQEAGRLDAR